MIDILYSSETPNTYICHSSVVRYIRLISWLAYALKKKKGEKVQEKEDQEQKAEEEEEEEEEKEEEDDDDDDDDDGDDNDDDCAYRTRAKVRCMGAYSLWGAF